MTFKRTYTLIRVGKAMLQNKLESQWPTITKVFLAHAKSDADVWDTLRGIEMR